MTELAPATPQNPLLSRHAQELRDTWQARALTEAKGRLQAVVQIVLFHGYWDAMPILLRVAFPGFKDIARPFLIGYATVTPNGRVVCDMACTDGLTKKVAIYEKESEMTAEFRAMADQLKFTDAERTEMFEAIRKWVTLDMRVNHHGIKVVQ